MARPVKYSDKQIIAALRKTRGMVYLAAENIGCEADTIYRRAKKSKAVQKAMEHERGYITDVAEGKLIMAIKNGEAWAVCFYLKTQGKDRGYVERTEQQQSGEITVVVKRVKGHDSNNG